MVSERGLVALGRPFPGVTIHVVAGDRPAPPARSASWWSRAPPTPPATSATPAPPPSCSGAPAACAPATSPTATATATSSSSGGAKNIIIQAGRNLAPQEIEEAVDALPFVRRTAAVGVDRGRAEGEQAYVFAELRRAAPPEAADLQEMARQMVERVHARLGLRPGRVVLLKPRSLPLTPNGKIRHAALRDEYLDGGLRERGRIVYPT